MKLTTSTGLPSCYPAYQLFCRAVESSGEERANLIARVDQALKDLGFSPEGCFLPIHDAEGDDFCSQPLRALSNTSIVIVQAGQYLAKHEPSEQQRDQTTVTTISKNVHQKWIDNLKKLGLDDVTVVRGLEIGRPERNVFSEDILPFPDTADDEESLKAIVEYLMGQNDKTVEVLINAPGYTLAKLIEEQPKLLKQKVKTIYMSGFGSVNTIDGMTSVLKLVELAQAKDAHIAIIIRDGFVFRPAEDLNFLFIQALKKLANECNSSFASQQLEMIHEWKQFDLSSRQVRAIQGKDVSQATKERIERLKIIKERVQQVSGKEISDDEQTVLSDLFMWVLAYTNKAHYVTEDFEQVDIKREFKPRSRERVVDLQPCVPGNKGIFKRVTDLAFRVSKFAFDDIEFLVDKDSYLALSLLFTLLKKA